MKFENKKISDIDIGIRKSDNKSKEKVAVKIKEKVT
jgi:hypothetical protein